VKRPAGFDRSPENAPDDGNERQSAQTPSSDENKTEDLSEIDGEIGESFNWFRPKKRQSEDDQSASQERSRLAKARDLAQSVWDRDRTSSRTSADDKVKDADENAESTRPARDVVGESDKRVRLARKQLSHAKRTARKKARKQKRKFSEFRRRQRRKWFIGIGAVLFLAVIVGAGVFTPVMAVRDIEIVGASKVDTKAVQKALKPLEGTPIALVSDDDVYAALKDFDLIQKYRVEKLPPHDLIVRLQERTPVVVIQEEDEFRQYDSAGVVISRSEKKPKNLPVAEGSVRNPGSETFTAAATVLRNIPEKLRSQTTSVSAESPEEVTLTLKSGVEVLWGSSDDSRFKAVVLDRMINALKNQNVNKIDVSSSHAPVFE
jgi:cell division protein FtsQ